MRQVVVLVILLVLLGFLLLASGALFIVDETGTITWRATPFREIDPTAYEELAAALAEIAPPAEGD